MDRIDSVYICIYVCMHIYFVYTKIGYICVLIYYLDIGRWLQTQDISGHCYVCDFSLSTTLLFTNQLATCFCYLPVPPYVQRSVSLTSVKSELLILCFNLYCPFPTT